MMRNTFCLTLALFLAGNVARAQMSLVYTGAAGESNVVNSLGTAINGDTVSIGVFTNGFDPTLPGNASNLAALQGHWANFDSTTTHQILGVDGRFAGSSPTVNDPIFLGKQIYLWVTETSGSTVTEYGLFSSSNPDWIFPSQAPSGNPALNPISSNEVNEFLFGDGISSGGGGSLQTAVTVVPEPSSLALIILGLGTGRIWFRRTR